MFPKPNQKENMRENKAKPNQTKFFVLKFCAFIAIKTEQPDRITEIHVRVHVSSFKWNQITRCCSLPWHPRNSIRTSPALWHHKHKNLVSSRTQLHTTTHHKQHHGWCWTYAIFGLFTQTSFRLHVQTHKISPSMNGTHCLYLEGERRSDSETKQQHSSFRWKFAYRKQKKSRFLYRKKKTKVFIHLSSEHMLADVPLLQLQQRLAYNVKCRWDEDSR